MSIRDSDDDFITMYRRTSENLFVYFYRRTFDLEATADLVSETYAVALERRDSYRERRGSPDAWVFGIARRVLGRHRRAFAADLRAVKRLAIVVPQVDAETAEMIVHRVDSLHDRLNLGAALADLPVALSVAVVARVVDDRSYREVAEMLGCSEGAARVRVHRGLARLAKAMEQHE